MTLPKIQFPDAVRGVKGRQLSVGGILTFFGLNHPGTFTHWQDNVKTSRRKYWSAILERGTTLVILANLTEIKRTGEY